MEVAMKANLSPQFKNGKYYLRIQVGDGSKQDGKQNRIFISTGIAVDKNHWDSKRKQIKKHPKFHILNKEFNEKFEFVQDFIFDNRNNRELTVDDVRAAYIRKFVTNSKSKSKSSTRSTSTMPRKRKTLSFLEMVKKHLDEIDKSGKYKKKSMDSKRKQLNLITECFSFHKINPTINQLNLTHWDLIQAYCTNVKKYENTSVNNVRKELKAWMNHFIKYEKTSNQFHTKIEKLKAPPKIYPVLNEAEVEKIKSLNLDNSNLKKYHTLMLVQLATGLRISDLMTIKEENIDKDARELVMLTEKNKSNIRIPLSDDIFKLIEEYDFKLPSCCDQKYNDHIKILCEKAEITQPFLTVRYLGKDTIKEYVPKNELIASHSLRRSFITNSIKKGLKVELLMLIVGTRDRKTLDKYIHLDEDDAVNAMREIIDP
jgi:site-specific recombinase XerD